ncbi:MAG: PEP-CTERM sorting domain-containing protein [Gemmatimonadaceae bacterium]
MTNFLRGPLRWTKSTVLAVSVLAAAAPVAGAQYNFIYSVYQNYTPGIGGAPFSNLLCTGLTANIFYDNNPATTTPKFADLCPAVGPAQTNFGAEFFAYMFTWDAGYFDFYVGSEDGSSLSIDGVDVLDLPGTHIFENHTVSVYLAAMAHTYTLDYYANDIGVWPELYGKAIQATVDPRLNVTPYPEPVYPLATPEPSTLVLFASGIGVFGVAAMRRRRRTFSRQPVSVS